MDEGAGFNNYFRDFQEVFFASSLFFVNVYQQNKIILCGMSFAFKKKIIFA
jgi:hypothetical protein